MATDEVSPLYLASPYSHPNPAVRQARFEAACRAAAKLFKDGHHVISPVVYTHPIAQHGLPLDWAFWQSFDRHLLEMCDELWVLTLPGWRESRGVLAEVRLASESGKPVRYVDRHTNATLASVASSDRKQG